MATAVVNTTMVSTLCDVAAPNAEVTDTVGALVGAKLGGRVERVGAAADTVRPPAGTLSPGVFWMVVVRAVANAVLKAEVAERDAVTLLATSADTPEIEYPTLMPPLRRLRVEARRLRVEAVTVRVMALSLRAVSDSCVLSVDLKDAW